MRELVVVLSRYRGGTCLKGITTERVFIGIVEVCANVDAQCVRSVSWNGDGDFLVFVWRTGQSNYEVLPTIWFYRNSRLCIA